MNKKKKEEARARAREGRYKFSRALRYTLHPHMLRYLFISRSYNSGEGEELLFHSRPIWEFSGITRVV